MSKHIGEMIRELRKRDNITQEKLAEILGCSFQSISRWENGLSYPDITLIPMIARYFHVTTDTLLGMEQEDSQRQQDEFEQEYLLARSQGQTEQCIALMEKARKQFPHKFHFLMNLAESLDMLSEGSSSQQKLFKEKDGARTIRSLCDIILEDCTIDYERFRAIQLMVKYYAQSGNTSAAMSLLDGIADFKHCRERLLENVLNGDEKIHLIQHTMQKAMDYIAETLVKMAFQKEYGLSCRLSADEKIRYIETAIELYKRMLPDGNYLYYHRMLAWNYRRLAECYVLKEDLETACSHLETAAFHADAFDALNESPKKSHPYSSPFFNSLIYTADNSPAKNWEGSESHMLLYRLNEMKDYFKGHAGYSRLVEQLSEKISGQKRITIE